MPAPAPAPAPAPETVGDAVFRILTETTASAIFIFQGTRFHYVNTATEALTGYSRDELLRMNFYDLFPPGIKKSIRNTGLQMQRDGSPPQRGLFKILTKSREERWIDLNLGVFELNGKLAGYGTAVDITDRRRAEMLQDAVYRIAQSADRSKSLDELFPAVHAIIGEVMPARNFYIALHDFAQDLITFPYYVDEHDRPPPVSKPGKGVTDYVLRTGRSLLCDPATSDALEQLGEVELVGTPSPIWLGVPLKIDNQVIGVMAVQDYADASVFGEREQRILEFVSSQVAMAINRKRAEEALRDNESRIEQRVNELAALYETTRDAATQRDTTTLIQAIVDRAAQLLGAAGGSIYLYNEERNELELMVAHGDQSFVGKRLGPGEGLVGQVMQTLRPMAVDDYRTWEFRSNKFDSLPVTAVIAVPMLYSGELVGVLSVNEVDHGDGSTVRLFNQADIDLLTFFAGSAASAVHSTRLFEETRQRLIELEVLYQASLAAAQIHSLRAVAQRIIDALMQLMHWQGSIWVSDPERLKPLLLAYGSQNLAGDALKAELARIEALIDSYDKGIIGWVCKNGQAIRTGDVRANPYYVESSGETVSELCVPLKVGGKNIGCINVESVQPDAFSEHDERLLITIANQAAIAIENARLFEEARRRAVRQAALNSIIISATRTGTDLDSLLNIAIEQVLQALGLDIGAIWLGWSPNKVQRVAGRGIPPTISVMMGNAAASGRLALARTLAVTDWREEEHPFSEMFNSMAMRAAIVVPLQTDGRRIGGLAVAAPQPRQWTVEEISLVESVGREVGAAVERARLFEETRVRLTELEAINKVSTSLRLANSMDEMLPDLLDETLKTLNAETGGIWLNNEKGKLRLMVGRGWCANLAEVEFGRGTGIPGTVFDTGDIYYSHEVVNDPLTSPHLDDLIPAGWSAVCVPIRAEQETIGVFLLSVQLPREPSSEDARLLITLAEMAGNAIWRMRLLEQTNRHAAELEARVAERTAELMEALKKAQEADRLKSEFVANVNHELRTPLTNLVLYYQMLRAQPKVKTEERLDVIGRELQRLRSLIEELLSLSRLDLGQVAFRFEFHDLNTLVRTLVDDRRSLAEEHGLALEVALQPDLPRVVMDESMMVQAVSNLLTNALNYTPPGGRVRVSTAMEKHKDETWVMFSVEDSGSGIGPEELPHLFERFYRGKAGRESGAPGTGLGLAIVRQVVERHSGRIEVGNGKDGQGAVFTVYLPVKKHKHETR